MRYDWGSPQELNSKLVDLLFERHAGYITRLVVSLEGDTVVLRGEVASESCRGDAKRLALAFEGVFKVRNELVVAAFLESATDSSEGDYFGQRTVGRSADIGTYPSHGGTRSNGGGRILGPVVEYGSLHDEPDNTTVEIERWPVVHTSGGLASGEWIELAVDLKIDATDAKRPISVGCFPADWSSIELSVQLFASWASEMEIVHPTIVITASDDPNPARFRLRVAEEYLAGTPAIVQISFFHGTRVCGHETWDLATIAAAAVTWPFLRVTVPSQAMGMLPHFAIVGHELGHAIQSDIKVDLSNVNSSTVITGLSARLKTEGIAFSRAHQMETQQILASWINELKSDAIGCLLAGPAFLFALGAFFELSGGGYGIGPSHPPSEMRRRLVLERLALGAPNHVEVFKEQTGTELSADLNSPHLKALPADDSLYAELKLRHGPQTAAICVALLPYAEAVAPLVFAEAEKVVRAFQPDMVYDAVRLREDLAEHLEPLRHLVPPIEIRKAGSVQATSLAGILNVGWAGLLTQLDRIPTPAGVTPGSELPVKMEKLHELLLKALELSEARLVWEEQV